MFILKNTRTLSVINTLTKPITLTAQDKYMAYQDTFRPLLSAKIEDEADFLKLKFPLIVSPKIDGIRVIVLERSAVTRKLKEVPNRSIHRRLNMCPKAWDLDGEITFGTLEESTHPDTF